MGVAQCPIAEERARKIEEDGVDRSGHRISMAILPTCSFVCITRIASGI